MDHKSKKVLIIIICLFFAVMGFVFNNCSGFFSGGNTEGAVYEDEERN